MQRKMRSVRLVCFHLITFALIIIPTGLFIFARRLLARVEIQGLSSTLQPGGQLHNLLGIIFGSISFIYCMFNPLISLLLIESNSISRVYKCFCCTSYTGQEETDSLNLSDNTVSTSRQVGCQQLEMMARYRARVRKAKIKQRRRELLGSASRFSTYALSAVCEIGEESGEEVSASRSEQQSGNGRENNVQISNRANGGDQGKQDDCNKNTRNCRYLGKHETLQETSL